MLNLILADSELETVPVEISSHEAVQNDARRRGKEATELILDSNYHHTSMDRLEDHKRRGRPDIVHVCLLTALDSPLNREGQLRFHVHTRQDKIIEVDPETRIPRSYNRFIGLMEQLFQVGRVPPEDPLIEIRDMSLGERLDNIGPTETIGLSVEGEEIEGKNIFKDVDMSDDLAVIVGGFPHGEFISDVRHLADRMISIYSESLDAVTAVARVIHFYEDSLEII